MAKQTLIKRYPNRRLYDTVSSRYITLDDLALRVREGEEIRVVEAATEEDITRRVLLQLVLLEGQGIADLLPEEFLYTLLRLKSPATVEMFLRYLRSSTDAFQLARTQMEEGLKRFEEQARLTAQLVSGFFPFVPGMPGPAASGPPRAAPPAPPTAPLPDDEPPPATGSRGPG
ncbi:MAG: polyhydroxyalkanoate synthesis regulator DNA-binding domain-containing protein [Myxococcota bacterium]|nr:polyhydroxyalkanoate synthesis regulator DNA-binding domain-containing protein [Myxococcota bacterium]